MSYNDLVDLVSQLLCDKDERKIVSFCHFQNSIVFLMKGKLLSTIVNPFFNAAVKKSAVMYQHQQMVAERSPRNRNGQKCATCSLSHGG